MKLISTILFAGTVISSLLVHVHGLEAATETVLYSFCSQQNCADGAQPSASIIDENNVLYGTTYGGGTGSGCRYVIGCGTAFSLDLTSGTEAVLHSFVGGTDGTEPLAGLVDLGGKLYGTTSMGGYYDTGTAFSVAVKNDRENVLFQFGCCSDGLYPESGLIHHKNMLYGTTQGGGIYGRGTLFSLNPKTGSVSALYAFCGQQSCPDGAYPLQLIDIGGMFYGTTESGGAGNGGTVFSFDPETGTETVLYSFCSQQNCADGDFPESGLVRIKGRLYGTTAYGGEYDSGTVFSLDLKGNVETVLHSFNYNDSDGWEPNGGVIDIEGTLYGTTYYGGSGVCYSGNENEGCGTVFALDLKTGAENVLYSFQNNGADGENPYSNLIYANGTLYGTTQLGGTSREGTVFSITP